MTKRPNILLITSDQQRGDCYGFAGRGVRTPHLDALAASGTRFDTCITPCVVCQPARASILTGQLPLTHGVADNGINLSPEVARHGFAQRLSDAGYHTGLIGKAHFSSSSTFEPTGTPECKFSSADFGPDWHGPYMGFDHVELATLGKWYPIREPITPPNGQHYENWVFDVVGDRSIYDSWKSDTMPGTGAAQTWSSGIAPAFHTSTWCANRAISFLGDHTEQDEPFCLWVSFPDPHHPFDCPDPWSRLHPREDVDIPAERVRDLDNRPWWHRASLEGNPALKDASLHKFRTKFSRAEPQTDEQLRDMTANYFGMISLIDHNVGRILANLDELGLSDDTIVIYTSDHGDLLGDHGLYLKGPTPYEGLLNVGLIARGPSVQKGHSVDEPVSLLDLAETFCDYAGANSYPAAQGKSLRALMEGGEDFRTAAYSEWNVSELRCGVPLDLRTVRTRTEKLTVELNSGAGEMYDLVQDPSEMTNVFDDPAHAEMRERLVDVLNSRPGPKREQFDAAVGMS